MTFEKAIFCFGPPNAILKKLRYAVLLKYG